MGGWGENPQNTLYAHVKLSKAVLMNNKTYLIHTKFSFSENLAFFKETQILL